jgi:hypothetical protein
MARPKKIWLLDYFNGGSHEEDATQEAKPGALCAVVIGFPQDKQVSCVVRKG